jgi:CheY-like chemotaxis protein
MLPFGQQDDVRPDQYTVLIVDDNKVDRMQAMRILEKSQHVCNARGFETGRELIEYLTKEDFYKSPVLHHMPLLVLLDLHLPGVMDGMDVLRLLREHPLTRVIPIIMLTGDASGTRMQEAHQLQANAYIPKPLSLTNLHEVIGACGPARMKTGTP